MLDSNDATRLLVQFGNEDSVSLEDAIAHVLSGGCALLTRRLQLKRVVYEGRRRVEVIGEGTVVRAMASRAESAGMEVVRHGYVIRCFLPEEDGADALRNLDETLAVMNLLSAAA